MARAQIVVEDKKLPAKGFILDGIDTSSEPTFSVSEVGKFFFARSSHWVRLLERDGFFEFRGEAVGNRRTSQGVRVYSLSDVEKMARALAEHDRIDGLQLRHALQLVYSEAKLWGYIE